MKHACSGDSCRFADDGSRGATASAPAAKWKKEVWRAGLIDANKEWSKIPHAILKIQDAAYLGEGQSATLTGTKGKPATYKWVPGKQQDGILWVTYHAGQMSGAMHGKALDNAALLKSRCRSTPISISRDSRHR